MVYSPNADFSAMRKSVFEELPGHANLEKFLLAVASSYLVNGDVVVDAGANHGQHSRVFGKLVGEEGRVHCIEADPTLSKKLIKATQNLNLQIIVHNIALNDGNHEYVKFFSHKNRDQEGSLFLREDSKNYRENIVRASSLDFLDLPKVKLIKIEVEGAEFDVIKGSKTTILENQPLVSVELTRFGNSDLNYSPSEFLALIDDIDCRLYNLTGDLVSIQNWINHDFFMNHMNWIVAKGSSAEDFANNQLRKLAETFYWGATDQVPYPFKLVDHPIF